MRTGGSDDGCHCLVGGRARRIWKYEWSGQRRGSGLLKKQTYPHFGVWASSTNSPFHLVRWVESSPPASAPPVHSSFHIHTYRRSIPTTSLPSFSILPATGKLALPCCHLHLRSAGIVLESRGLRRRYLPPKLDLDIGSLRFPTSLHSPACGGELDLDYTRHRRQSSRPTVSCNYPRRDGANASDWPSNALHLHTR